MDAPAPAPALLLALARVHFRAGLPHTRPKWSVRKRGWHLLQGHNKKSTWKFALMTMTWQLRVRVLVQRDRISTLITHRDEPGLSLVGPALRPARLRDYVQYRGPHTVR